MVGALIFDMDGVLVDNTGAYREAWRRFAAEQDGALRPDYPAERTFGRRNAEVFAEAFRRPPAAAEAARMSERLEALYWEVFGPQMRPVHGAGEFLTAARRRRLPCALATSAPAANVALVLRKLGLEGAFAPVLTEGDVRHGKPDPEIYTTAAARLGLAASACVVFEDSLAGVAAARAAGKRCVALTTSYPAAELAAAGALTIVADFAAPELPRWLGWNVGS